jgi:ubiquinone/menaquinone biosynthesis C-methylase UbiE
MKDKDEPISTRSLVLDVGCGWYPQGDINVDIQKRKDRIPNFVKADGQHLPFRDNVFSLVNSQHAIEHTPNPFLFLKELFRVSKCQVVLRCPWRFERNLHRHPDHLHSFNKKSVESMMKLLPDCVYSSSYTGWLFDFLPLPVEMEFRIRKVDAELV